MFFLMQNYYFFTEKNNYKNYQILRGLKNLSPTVGIELGLQINQNFT
jgi:hypothetical protein